MPTMSEPLRDRPVVPDGYGLPESVEGMLDWAAVEDRLRPSLHYWMATTRPDGRPHVVPRWGVWLDGALWYDGSPDTVHVRNLTRDPRCTLHLEDGEHAVIVDGRSDAAQQPEPVLARRLSEAMTAKYGDRGYAPAADSWDGDVAGGLRTFTPSKALAWFDFPTDMTRFTF